MRAFGCVRFAPELRDETPPALDSRCDGQADRNNQKSLGMLEKPSLARACGRFPLCKCANARSTVKHSSIVGVFVCAIALFAAALGDAVVEGISNADVLWHGNYTDHSSLDILPAFFLAVVALVLTQGLSLFAQARMSGLSTRSLILSTSRVLTPREITRLLPAIFGLQLIVLFSMETIEQIAVYGHAFGGALWLGGPITVSLAIHAGVTVAAALSISNVLGVLGDMLTRMVKCICARFVACARSSMALSLKPVFYALALIVTDSLVERGPPRLVKPS